MNRTATTALGSLASLAVITMAGPALAAPADPASAAGDVRCGTPAVPAVFETVVHPATFETVEHAAVFRTVPAVTHLEWKWTRTVEVPEHKFQRTVTEQLVEWKRDAGVVEYEWTRQVVESAGTPGREAVAEQGHWETRVVTPAVMVTEYLYVKTRNDNPNARNEYWTDNPNWNAEVNEHSLGWKRTDQTRQVEGSPAVTDEVWVVDVAGQEAVEEVPPTYSTQTQWSAQRPSGADWAATGLHKAVISGVEQQLLPLGELPEGDGWYQTGATYEGSAHTENLWAETHPGGDWVATGQQRPGRSTIETTRTHSATAPDAGWTRLDGSETTVVDEAEKTVEVTPAWTEKKMVKAPWAEQVKVADAIPAGPECPTDAPAVPDVDEPPAELPEVEVPDAELPDLEPEPEVEVPTTTPIVLGEELETEDEATEETGGQPADDEQDTPESVTTVVTTPTVLGVEATADTTVRTTTGPAAVPTSVDAGLATELGSALAPTPGSDWRQATGLFALAAGVALYAVPLRRRAGSR